MVRCIFLDQSLAIPQNCPTNRVHLKNAQNNEQFITLKLDPKVIAWVKKETKKRKISDQKLINTILL
jgi:hypothetical protein